VTDIANLRALPNMTVIVPADANEAAQFVPLVAEYDGPVYLRISRGSTLPVHTSGSELKIGKGIVRREGGDVTLVATGSMVGRSMQAAELLADKGVQAMVVEIHTIKPLDVDLLNESARKTGALVTVEEHAKIGGLGSAVAEVLAESFPVPMQRIGLADVFMPTGRTVEGLLDACGLAVADIVSAAQQVIQRK